MSIQVESEEKNASSIRLRVGLFIPCYIDMIFPEAGIATLQLLERFGVDVGFPLTQTCCEQPMSNSGDEANAAAAERLFVENFAEYEYIVGPAGSCVKQVRSHFDSIEQTDDVKHVRQQTLELVEFLHDVLKVEAFPWAEFHHSVAIHNSWRRGRRVLQAENTTRAEVICELHADACLCGLCDHIFLAVGLPAF